MKYISIISAALELAKLVPIIIKWLRGEKMGPVSEKIVEIAKRISNETDETKLFDSISNDPNAVIEFQQRVIELEKELCKLSHKEHKNARDRDIEMMKAGKSNVRAHVMVSIAAIGLIACPLALALSMLWYRNNLPGEVIVIISTIAGIFGSCLKDAYAFEFGSSRSSREKDERTFSFMNSLKNNKN